MCYTLPMTLATPIYPSRNHRKAWDRSFVFDTLDLFLGFYRPPTLFGPQSEEIKKTADKKLYEIKGSKERSGSAKRSLPFGRGLD
jgi:hypothetical protein